jgi:hypothetical protein
VFLHHSCIGLFGKKLAFSTLKILSCWKYSFKKITQLSQGKNVLDAAALNKDDFLWRDTVVSSTQMSSPIWSKESLFPS